MKKNRIGQCYLCGAVGKMTKEHVPPKFISPKSPNSEFAFVSVCASCNNSNSHEENKFRDFLATAGAFKGSKSADDAYEAMKRNFMSNSVARLLFGRPSKDLLRIVQNIRRKDIYTPAGIYLGTQSIIMPPKDVAWESIIVKIARSLQFLFNGKVVPSNYIMHAQLIDKIDRPDLYEKAHQAGHAGDFFHFKGGWAKEDPKSGLWYMMFYKKLGAMAWFINPTAVQTKKMPFLK